MAHLVPLQAWYEHCHGCEVPCPPDAPDALINRTTLEAITIHPLAANRPGGTAGGGRSGPGSMTLLGHCRAMLAAAGGDQLLGTSVAVYWW